MKQVLLVKLLSITLTAIIVCCFLYGVYKSRILYQSHEEIQPPNPLEVEQLEKQLTDRLKQLNPSPERLPFYIKPLPTPTPVPIPTQPIVLQTTPSLDIANTLNAAQSSFNSGDYAKTISLCVKILEGAPSESGALELKSRAEECASLLKQGIALFSSGKLSEAKTIFQRVLSLSKQDKQAAHYLKLIEGFKTQPSIPTPIPQENQQVLTAPTPSRIPTAIVKKPLVIAYGIPDKIIEGEPLTFTVTVEDPSLFSSVILNYRYEKETEYRVVKMAPEGQVFRATIPKGHVRGSNLYYSIELIGQQGEQVGELKKGIVKIEKLPVVPPV